MTHVVRLNDSEIRSRMASVPDWRFEEDALHRELHFRDFVNAFAFMTSVAMIAERMNHHPEWRNVYGTVTIRLLTHDVDGISENDFALAMAISDLYQRLGRSG